MALNGPVTTRSPLSTEERVLVMNQLERILASPLFSQSKRYAPFLRYVVQKTLDRQEGSLKERTVGVEVFGRKPTYDSNNDPIVRVTASEVRRRIAQYYHDPAHQNELWIDLPTGTYVAQFRSMPGGDENGAIIEPPALQVEEAAPLEMVGPLEVAVVGRSRLPRRRIAAVVAVLAILASAYLVWKFGVHNPSPVDRVWGDAISANSPSVVAMGEPYLFPLENKNNDLSARQHLRSVYVTYSDLQALLRVVKLLDQRHAVYSVQPASGTSFADLRQGPAILLGGLDNPWMMRAQKNLRYRLDSDGNGVDWIFDARVPDERKWSVDFNRPYAKVNTDFAIVAHFRDPSTQQPTLVIAGLGENGTKAASEFLTDETQLKSVLGESLQKPGGGNFEIVLTTEVINGTSGAPKVLAKELW